MHRCRQEKGACVAWGAPRMHPCHESIVLNNSHPITLWPWWHRVDTVWFCCVLCSSGTFLRATSDPWGDLGECSTRQVAGAVRSHGRAVSTLLCAASGHGSMSWNSLEIQSKEKHEAPKDIPVINGSRNEWCLPIWSWGAGKDAGTICTSVT